MGVGSGRVRERREEKNRKTSVMPTRGSVLQAKAAAVASDDAREVGKRVVKGKMRERANGVNEDEG